MNTAKRFKPHIHIIVYASAMKPTFIAEDLLGFLPHVVGNIIIDTLIWKVLWLQVKEVSHIWNLICKKIFSALTSKEVYTITLTGSNPAWGGDKKVPKG